MIVSLIEYPTTVSIPAINGLLIARPNIAYSDSVTRISWPSPATADSPYFQSLNLSLIYKSIHRAAILIALIALDFNSLLTEGPNSSKVSIFVFFETALRLDTTFAFSEPLTPLIVLIITLDCSLFPYTTETSL